MEGQKNYNEQAIAYHGISGLKYAVRDNDNKPGTKIENFPYAKSIGVEPQVEEEKIYANDMQIGVCISEQGSTGELGTTAQDRNFEKAIGHIIDIENGTADVNLISNKRVDFFYKYKEKTASGTEFVVKVWLLNVEVSKASKSHESDENTAKLGEYKYPITAYGDKLKNTEGTEIYVDADGNERTVTRIISVPSDKGYADFEKTVPIPKMVAETTPEEPESEGE